jgi:hypothetical protein
LFSSLPLSTNASCKNITLDKKHGLSSSFIKSKNSSEIYYKSQNKCFKFNGFKPTEEIKESEITPYEEVIIIKLNNSLYPKLNENQINKLLSRINEIIENRGSNENDDPDFVHPDKSTNELNDELEADLVGME